MPKSGTPLSEYAVRVIKEQLSDRGISQAAFARDWLYKEPRTFRNWLSRKTGVSNEEIEAIAKALGIGIEDLLGESKVPNSFHFYFDVIGAVEQVVKRGLSKGGEAYTNVTRLFNERVCFTKLPLKGYFRAFEHKAEGKKVNHYYHVKLSPIDESPREKVRFVFSFTVSGFHRNLLRIEYGEVILRPDKVEIVQYYQTPNFELERSPEDPWEVTVATWFDKLPHTFIVTSDVPFDLSELGKISEEELQRRRAEIACLPKHFFFHPDDSRTQVVKIPREE